MIEEILGLIGAIVILAGIWIAVYVAAIGVLILVGIPFNFLYGWKRKIKKKPRN